MSESEAVEKLEKQVWEQLKEVRFPGMSRDIVSFGFVDGVEVEEGHVRVALSISTRDPERAEEVRQEVERSVAGIEGVDSVEVGLEVAQAQPQSAASATARNPELIPEVERVVAVASGKGGVGKSTVAANLAVALANEGHRVGLLDADIYGPSMPLMFGISERPRVIADRIQPFEKYGIRLMSLGFVLDTDTPVIWRGPMVMKALEQMLGDVDWGELDYMIVDLPPGTGDAQLTLAQRVPLSGAVIVTTPQDIALIDARKGLAMFQKVNVPVLGIIENMSGFVCPHCGETTDIFKRGGGERTAATLGTSFLGSVPLDPAIVEGGDAGRPIVTVDRSGEHVEAFRRVAEAVAQQISAQDIPNLVIG